MGIIEPDADYERILPRLYPSRPVNADQWRAWAEEQQQGNVVLWFTVDGFFWFARRLLGIERHRYSGPLVCRSRPSKRRLTPLLKAIIRRHCAILAASKAPRDRSLPMPESMSRGYGFQIWS